MHELKWLTIGERIYFHRAILMYKALNNLTPYYITNKFYHIRHTYSTRSAQLNKLVLPKCKLLQLDRDRLLLGELRNGMN